MTVMNDDAVSIAKKLGRQNEGYRQFPYRDSSPKRCLSIGIGRNLETDGLSLDEAEYLQMNDIRNACDILAKRIPWYADMTPARQAVFIDMVFNMEQKFFTFEKMLAHAKNQKYEEAAQEILDSKWLTQVGDRCRRAAEMMKSGVYVIDQQHS